jgi:glutaredoxin
MVVKVYISNVSGNMEIRSHQEFILSVLKARKIDYEEIDISDPARETDKKFMREKTPPKDGKPNVLPPQIFNDDNYCCDYESFHDAVECNTINELLGLSS